MDAETPAVRLDALFRSGKYVEGVSFAFEMIHKFGETSFFCFCLGRNFLYLNEQESAIRWLERAAEAAPVFAWAHYELCRLYDILDKFAAAATEAARFLAAREADPDGVQLNRTHQDNILRIAHRCFMADRSAAMPLYADIRRAGFGDYLTNLRVAEAELDAARPGAAMALLEDIQATQPLDAWGLFCLARAHRALGDVEPAAQIVSRAVETVPNNLTVRITAAHRLLELGRLADAQRLLRTAETAAEAETHAGELIALRFRLAVFAGDHADVLRQAAQAGGFSGLPNWLLVESVFTLAKPGDQITPADLETATLIVRHLESHWPYPLPTVLALFLFYNRRRMWSEALALVERLRPEPVFDDPEVTLRVFELYCITAQLEAAKALYAARYAGRPLGQSESAVVIRFLCEVRDWDAAAGVLLDFLDNQYVFPQGEYLILQICRRRNLHAQALAHIDALGAAIPATMKALRQVIADDLCVFLGQAVVLPEAQAGRGARAASLSRHNAALLKPAPHAAEPAGAGGLIGFLCADRNYFLSVLTFLASYAVNNPERQGNLEWAVFLDRSVPAAWGDLLHRFAAKIGVPLQVVREEEFVASDAVHLESYGIFTGGSTLSRAAYLRIYAARHLLARGIFRRAFYLDTDIICQRSIEPFLELEFGEAALMARPEEDIPEVADAATQHGLAPGCYFNSGVLVFNFEHEDMAALLDGAVRLSEAEQERLIYHDQCALNIAFKNRVRFLEPQFNHFMRPHRPDNGDYDSAVFVHFLDKPKPWDVSFTREYRTVFTEYLQLTRLLLPAAQFMQLVQAANGGDLRPKAAAPAVELAPAA